MRKMMQITALAATSLFCDVYFPLSPPVPHCFVRRDVFVLFDEKCPCAFTGNHLIH